VAEELNQAVHAGGLHGLQQADGADDVVVVIAQRLLHRFAHRLEPGKVHHGGGLGGLQRGLQRGAVADVALDHPQRAARDALDPAQRFALRVAEVVVDGDGMAGGEQFDAGVRTDVAGAAGDENHVCGFFRDG